MSDADDVRPRCARKRASGRGGWAITLARAATGRRRRHVRPARACTRPGRAPLAAILRDVPRNELRRGAGLSRHELRRRNAARLPRGAACDAELVHWSRAALLRASTRTCCRAASPTKTACARARSRRTIRMMDSSSRARRPANSCSASATARRFCSKRDSCPARRPLRARPRRSRTTRRGRTSSAGTSYVQARDRAVAQRDHGGACRRRARAGVGRARRRTAGRGRRRTGARSARRPSSPSCTATPTARRADATSERIGARLRRAGQSRGQRARDHAASRTRRLELHTGLIAGARAATRDVLAPRAAAALFAASRGRCVAMSA